jgi:hypothetical protein
MSPGVPPWHLLAVQMFEGHVFPQAPQFRGSFVRSTHFDPQPTSGGMQTGAQMELPFTSGRQAALGAAHTIPHPPQAWGVT